MFARVSDGSFDQAAPEVLAHSYNPSFAEEIGSSDGVQRPASLPNTPYADYEQIEQLYENISAETTRDVEEVSTRGNTRRRPASDMTQLDPIEVHKIPSRRSLQLTSL